MRIWMIRVGAAIAVIACSAHTRPQADSDRSSADVLAAEQARFAAMTRADIAALDTLLAGDLIYTHTTGNVETKEQFLESLRVRRIHYERITPRELQLRRPTSNVAVITGRARVGVTLADGRQEFDIRFTDVLVRRGDRWQTAIWQSTRLAPAADASGNPRPPQN